MIDWRQHDTVLLDMDGTVLDLAFDNYFWREVLPRCIARATGQDRDSARADLFGMFAEVQGELDWYCLDYWAARLDLDLYALKSASSQRIRFLPGAREFLVRLGRMGKRVVLVTNAHENALELKNGIVGLDRFFERLVSSHSIGHAKEHDEFWNCLQSELGFNAASTLFVDDSLPVLDTAARFGIRSVVAVTRPDSRQPANDPGAHAAVSNVLSLL